MLPGVSEVAAGASAKLLLAGVGVEPESPPDVSPAKLVLEGIGFSAVSPPPPSPDKLTLEGIGVEPDSPPDLFSPAVDPPDPEMENPPWLSGREVEGLLPSSEPLSCADFSGSGLEGALLPPELPPELPPFTLPFLSSLESIHLAPAYAPLPPSFKAAPTPPKVLFNDCLISPA